MFLIRYLLCIIVYLCTIINPIIMNEVVSFNQVEKKIIKLRNVNVIIDSDVAELYGVETKEVNQAVKNNPKKSFRKDMLLN